MFGWLRLKWNKTVSALLVFFTGDCVCVCVCVWENEQLLRKMKTSLNFVYTMHIHRNVLYGKKVNSRMIDDVVSIHEAEQTGKKLCAEEASRG